MGETRYVSFLHFTCWLSRALSNWFLVVRSPYSHDDRIARQSSRYPRCAFWNDVGQISRWRHHMETFSASLAICVGNSPVPGEFPAQRPVTRNFDVFFDLHLNKRLSKQSRGWWFETPLYPLWRHCNVSSQGPKCNIILSSFAKICIVFLCPSVE